MSVVFCIVIVIVSMLFSFIVQLMYSVVSDRYVLFVGVCTSNAIVGLVSSIVLVLNAVTPHVPAVSFMLTLYVYVSSGVVRFASCISSPLSSVQLYRFVVL